MKLLVTGGAGFIGSNFILFWLKNHPQDQIVNLDKLTYAGNLENLKEVENNKNYKFIHGDICDAEVVEKAIEGVDVLVNFAAETHVDRSILGPAIFVNTNVGGTQVLLDVALKKKIKLFYQISTDEVFGQLSLTSTEKFTENTPYNPRSPYSASKAGADHLVRAYHYTYQLPIIISNCSNNFGPFMFPEKFFPLAITNILEGKKVPVYGDGLYVRDWLYVEDHARAIDLIIHKGKIGETYLIGGMSKGISNKDAIKKILFLMGKDESSIEYVKDRPGHDRKYDVNYNKLKQELGWEPKYSFEEGLKLMIEWYKDNKSWWEKIKSGEYKNYYQKQYGNL